MNKILVIGDTHFKDSLSYSEYIKDGREKEKENTLNFIVEQSKDCDNIVFLGDFFNSKNNSSNTVKQAVSFLEKFGDKQIYIISGNHSKKGDGSTAIDFIKEIKNKKWKIFSKPHTVIGAPINKTFHFLPYMLNSELEVENSEDVTKKIMNMLQGGDILFTHHAISDTTFLGISTNTLSEVVLPKAELEKKYKLIMAGHIHEPGEYGQTILAGSVFTSTVGEVEKFIWKIDENLDVEKIKLPNREIHKLTDPTEDQLNQLKEDSIVKVIITDKSIKIDNIKKVLDRFDASLLIENYPDERKKAHIEEGAFSFEIESLLELYAKEKNVDYQCLLKGLQIINEETE